MIRPHKPARNVPALQTTQNCSAPAEHFHLARPRPSLRDNKLGDEGWTALFKALCENKGDKIESWNLIGEGVGPETAKTIAEYISVSPALKSIKCARLPTNMSGPADTC